MTSSGDFKVPSWAGKPPPGLHLDVLKDGTVLQKLLIDEKSYYLFGRNKDSCDFFLQHDSCSRQHAALVYHKHLSRVFVIDLGSTHGTFVGTLRLEPQKPTQLPIDTTIRFGASSRYYTLRERPPQVVVTVGEDGSTLVEGEGGALLGLPELDTEVDDLTQYNTAHNRQISMVGIQENEKPRKRKFRSQKVTFADEEEVINPEDVDPSIGKFRNMVQTTVIPAKKKRLNMSDSHVPISPTKLLPFTQPLSSPTANATDHLVTSPSSFRSFSINSSLFTKTISAAPPVENPLDAAEPHLTIPAPNLWANTLQEVASTTPTMFSESEPRKKKYAKEAWPGKKPGHLLV